MLNFEKKNSKNNVYMFVCRIDKNGKIIKKFIPIKK